VIKAIVYVLIGAAVMIPVAVVLGAIVFTLVSLFTYKGFTLILFSGMFAILLGMLGWLSAEIFKDWLHSHMKGR
jgi:hypothetical protein